MAGRHLSVRTRASFGIVYLSVLGLGVGSLLLQSQGAFRDALQVTSYLDSVGDGLPVGTEVRLRGVVVGRVSAVEPSLEQTVVHIDINPDYAASVPAAVETRLLPTNFFGAPHVDLRVIGEEQPAVDDGAVIPQDRSEAAVQVQTVFRKIYDLLVAVEPAKLNLLLTAIADGLRGNGDRIGEMIERGDRYLRALNPNAKLFQANLIDLASTLEGAQEAVPELLDAADNVSATARLLMDNRKDLRTLLVTGTRAAVRFDSFLDHASDPTIRLVNASSRLAEILGPVAPEIVDSLNGLSVVAGKTVTTLKPGGVRIAAVISTHVSPPGYTSADCPRYPGLDGPNCGSAAPPPAGVVRTGPASAGAEPPSASAVPDGGTVGSIGSPKELEQIGRIVGEAGSGLASGLAGLLAGPGLRGSTVVLR